LSWFKATPHSVLLATRSFWEGVDIPGDDLSLVVLDKMPFPTPADPLHSARMKLIEQDGRSSFGDYMAPLMTLALKQGFGRLIRRTSDRGVVAILDERLTSKAYGRRARNDLPAARFSRHFGDVYRFYKEALDSPAEFALNVWGEKADADLIDLDFLELDTPKDDASGDARWRWQLLRLQDGQADRAEGVLETSADPLDAEVHAATEGLRDLRARIERAGRNPDQFSVEIRASADGIVRLENDDSTPRWQTWRTERDAWRQIVLLACPDIE
jgi:ATP-dependent DNA helicase DinG